MLLANSHLFGGLLGWLLASNGCRCRLGGPSFFLLLGRRFLLDWAGTQGLAPLAPPPTLMLDNLMVGCWVKPAPPI